MLLKSFSARSTQHSSLIKEALREAVKTLQGAHVETASLDARMLLEYVLGLSREQLLFKLDDRMNAIQVDHFYALVARRAERQPIAQIIGKREFFGLSFRVTQDVLDPRPDSETLVEAVLKRCKNKQAPLRILDLGTGTGCLLLSLLYELPAATGVGVDISDAGLKIAQENALRLGLQLRAQFTHSHWCMQVEGEFDIIVSNPPYIPTADIAALPPEVAEYEPRLALDGGADGMNCYRAIAASLGAHLKPGGIAALELGFGQQLAVETIVKANHLKIAGVAHDLQGVARCLLITH